MDEAPSGAYADIVTLSDGSQEAIFSSHLATVTTHCTNQKIKKATQMIGKGIRRRTSFPTGSTLQIWTLVSLVQDKVSCSIHPSEYHAHHEAIVQFESAELGHTRRDPILRVLLEVSSACDDYQDVRDYIATNSRRTHLMQLTEHTVNDLSGYQVRAPWLGISRPVHVPC
jgi:hypothetical protein